MKQFTLRYGEVTFQIEADLVGKGGQMEIVGETKKSAGKKLWAALNGVGSLLLALACHGVDLESPSIVKAFTTAMDGVTNEYS